ncbi:MAG: ammonia-forming cytochrome c nitrite reductase subunit c552 [Cephaloticoccus sp.]|nr:ammonia-forming cytochrome c nitrite reductase subunit c552 [Cephaloticoccus sp.]MCF7760250.1 ammonia-forming cytochrome c nitrite reductase subunit c552 [Cephaloticoccus sp.]
MNRNENNATDSNPRSRRRTLLILGGVILVTTLVTFGITALLITIFEHRQEARVPFVRLTEVNEVSTDPAPWGKNWPHQHDTYLRTVDNERTEFGGSSALTQSKLETQPWLRRLYAGYAFSIDYRELRGHAYMLYDQEVTERVTKRTQSGACLHCHASIIPTYRRLGLTSFGQDASPEALAADFNWPAVMEGFRLASTMDYATARAELLKTPDGTPAAKAPLLPGSAPDMSDPHQISEAHPVSCIDCHAPDTMKLRVTRPGFINGIAALARSADPVPHLPSVERWRKGNRTKAYDPNADASRREMRAFACAQCHVEYYCASKETLFFPWQNGLKVEQIEKTYEEHKFPDGTPFYDYRHGETGAPAYKAQHPEFELWSQGIHARSGVSCTDCHMPYERQGAMKVTSHWVRSPLLNINNSCQTCHNVPEDELREKVATIQNRTRTLIDRAAVAMTDMLDAIREAQAAGATEAELKPLFELQRKGMWRLDFISSENSAGFHADQESARILAESIDYSRQAQALAVRLRAPTAPEVEAPTKPVEGVTPTERPPGI